MAHSKGPKGEAAALQQSLPTQLFDLQDCMGVIPTRVKDMVTALKQPDFAEVLEQTQCVCRDDQVLTSVFSGIGSFECVATWAHSALQQEFGLELEERGQLVVYSVTELDPHCQLVLPTMDPPPMHRFSNIKDRLHPQDRTRIDETWTCCKAQYEEVEAWHEAHIISESDMRSKSRKIQLM